MSKKNPEKYEKNKQDWAKERIEYERRKFALAAAAEVFRGSSAYHFDVIEAARKFEAYLLGEAPVSEVVVEVPDLDAFDDDRR